MSFRPSRNVPDAATRLECVLSVGSKYRGTVSAETILRAENDRFINDILGKPPLESLHQNTMFLCFDENSIPEIQATVQSITGWSSTKQVPVSPNGDHVVNICRSIRNLLVNYPINVFADDKELRLWEKRQAEILLFIGHTLKKLSEGAVETEEETSFASVILDTVYAFHPFRISLRATADATGHVAFVVDIYYTIWWWRMREQFNEEKKRILSEGNTTGNTTSMTNLEQVAKLLQRASPRASPTLKNGVIYVD